MLFSYKAYKKFIFLYFSEFYFISFEYLNTLFYLCDLYNRYFSQLVKIICFQKNIKWKSSQNIEGKNKRIN